MEKGLNKQQIISTLTRSPHGKLEEYIPITVQAQHQDAEFLAHLIAWNEAKGSIRDSKVALPVIALAPETDYRENALAHMCLRSPRDLVRAIRFGKQIGGRPTRQIVRAVERYLRVREANLGWFERTAITHRDGMKTLYGMFHVKPGPYAEQTLFKRQYPAGSLFAAVKGLPSMSASDAAATILTRKIPFLVAVSSLGKRAKDTDMVLALIDQMSPTELVTNAKMLERLGANDNGALRGAMAEGLARAAKSKTAPALKTTKAAEAVGSVGMKEKLQAVQEKQADNLSVDGDWLVLGDKSGSMQQSIDLSRQVAGLLAKMVKGKVSLVFFDAEPRAIDATGKTYEQITAMTKGVQAGGGTNVGIGIDWALKNKIAVDGIAITSDGEDFGNCAAYYEKYCKWLDKEVPVYFYKVPGGHNDTLTANMRGHDMHTFDLRGGFDYYSLPMLVQTMRTNKYSLADEIMAVPLLTLDDVFINKAVEE